MRKLHGLKSAIISSHRLGGRKERGLVEGLWNPELGLRIGAYG